MAKRASDAKREVTRSRGRLRVQLTPNQIVAYNLAQARACGTGRRRKRPSELEPYLGARVVEGELLRRRAIGRRRTGPPVHRRRDRGVLTRLRASRSASSSCHRRASAADAPIRLAAPEKPAWGIPARGADRRRLRAARRDRLHGDAASRSSSAKSRLELQTEAQRRLSQHTSGASRRSSKRDLDRFSDVEDDADQPAPSNSRTGSGVPARP